MQLLCLTITSLIFTSFTTVAQFDIDKMSSNDEASATNDKVRLQLLREVMFYPIQGNA